MKKNKILISVFVIILIAFYLGYKMYNKPHINVSNTKSEITLSANTILKDFTTDEAAANAKYLDKIITITGEVLKINTEKNKGTITLKTNDNFGSILCHLSKKATLNLNKIKKGQNVTIKGICTGYLMDVIIIKCELLLN